MTGKKKTEDLAVIVPEEGRVEIDGVKYKVKRLRLLELAALMRVLTNGLGPAMTQIPGLLEDSESIGEQLPGLLMVALPNAVEEFVVFLSTVLVNEEGDSPVGMVNPDLDSLLDVVSVVVEQEKDDLPALVGKAQRLWETQIKVLLPTGSTS